MLGRHSVHWSATASVFECVKKNITGGSDVSEVSHPCVIPLKERDRPQLPGWTRWQHRWNCLNMLTKHDFGHPGQEDCAGVQVTHSFVFLYHSIICVSLWSKGTNKWNPILPTFLQLNEDLGLGLDVRHSTITTNKSTRLPIQAKLCWVDSTILPLVSCILWANYIENND